MRHLNIKQWIVLVFLSISIAAPLSAQGGVLELSGNFGFSASSYGNGNFFWSRKWGASVGYYFFALSEVEFSAQDILYRTKIDSVEDTTFHDQIYSVDWVQSFFSKNSGFQPYLKLGVGQLTREANGTYSGGVHPPSAYGSLTAVIGAGLRIFILHTFALRAEGSSYLTDGVLSTWQNNVSFNAGVSVYF